MKRHALALLSALLLAGCATSRSNYYSYEGSGDYYYGSSTADVVIDSSAYVHRFGGFNGGIGYGYGYGYGYPYSWGGYGYQPIWWAPSQPHEDSGVLRDERVERERALRSALIRRDTLQAPDSTKRLRRQPEYSRAFTAPRVNADTRVTRPSASRRAVAPQRAAPIRRAPVFQSRPVPSRSSSMPAPTRSAPPARHKQ